MSLVDDIFLESKLKVSKFIESYEKSSASKLSFKYILEQLDVLDHIEEALQAGFNDSELLHDHCDQLSLKMWRNVIYPQIDYIRRLINTTKDGDERRSLAQQLDTSILCHLGRIGYLISGFTEGKKDKFESDAFLMDEFGEKQRKLLVRMLTYSGDLLRYRSSNNISFNSYDQFQSSKEFYELGHRVDPGDGSIFNQLAVIESVSSTKSIPMMIYLYSRALGSMEPFPVAKENLTRLLKKFGVLYNNLLLILEGNEPDLLSFIEMLKNHIGEEHLLYASALALGKCSNVAIPRIVLEDNPLMLLLNLKILKNDQGLDINFISTLIGCNFIKDSYQKELLKIFFNPPEFSSGNNTMSNIEASQHDPIIIPLSQ